MTKKKKLPSPRVLRRLISYDPETGELRWKERPVWMFAKARYTRSANAQAWNTRYAGKLALASIEEKGYLTGSLIMGVRVKAHRAAWAYHYGEWPSEQIDHINGVVNDNRILNLRVVSPSGNARNRSRRSDNTSGTMGVSWMTQHQKWKASITNRGQQIYLGIFTHKADAVAARKAAEVKYGFHPNHGRSK